MEPDLVGQKIGNYLLLSVLGTGGFSTVYLGEQIYHQEKVAIKVLKMRDKSDKARDRFLTEARTIAGLVHPHIVSVIECGVEVIANDNIPYIMMEYAKEGNLRNAYQAGKALPLEVACLLNRQAADALQYAHDRSIVHCDVKPENMLIKMPGQIMLADFGIASISDTADISAMANTMYSDMTISDNIQGTVTYMAPERFQGLIRRSSDQYSLGIVVYEWLTGRPPFTGTREQVMYKHLTAAPELLRKQNPYIPLEVEQAVLRAIEKDPSQRYGSVKEFAEALEQASSLSGPQSHVAFSGAPAQAPIVLAPDSIIVPGLQQASTVPGSQSAPGNVVAHQASTIPDLPISPTRNVPTFQPTISDLATQSVVNQTGVAPLPAVGVPSSQPTTPDFFISPTGGLPVSQPTNSDHAVQSATGSLAQQQATKQVDSISWPAVDIILPAPPAPSAAHTSAQVQMGTTNQSSIHPQLARDDDDDDNQPSFLFNSVQPLQAINPTPAVLMPSASSQSQPSLFQSSPPQEPLAIVDLSGAAIPPPDPSMFHYGAAGHQQPGGGGAAGSGTSGTMGTMHHTNGGGNYYPYIDTMPPVQNYRNSARGFAHVSALLAHFFATDEDFASQRRFRRFRPSGYLANILCAFAFGFIGHSWTISPLGFLGGILAILAFWLCIRLVKPTAAILVSLAIVAYWAWFGIALDSWLRTYPMLASLPSPLIVGGIFLVFSLVLHGNYINRRL